MIYQDDFIYIRKKEKHLDVAKIIRDLWKHRLLFLATFIVALTLSTVYAFSQYDYYTCTVKLSPELSATSKSSSLRNIAKSFGVKLGKNGAGEEALYPILYPELLNSVDFKTSLFPIKVRRDGSNVEMSYYEYLLSHQNYPWWARAKAAIISYIKGNTPVTVSGSTPQVNSFRLTNEQAMMASVVRSKVECDVDKKTQVITIKVTDQDPLVCATMADSVKMRLQQFITDYRTNKARVDMEYYKELYLQAKEGYDSVSQQYAQFADVNRDVIMERVLQELRYLENEMKLRYDVCQQRETDFLSAEMNVHKEKPAFTTLQSATVPVYKTGPSRLNMMVTFIFFVFLATTCWVLYKEGVLTQLLGTK